MKLIETLHTKIVNSKLFHYAYYKHTKRHKEAIERVRYLTVKHREDVLKSWKSKETK